MNERSWTAFGNMTYAQYAWSIIKFIYFHWADKGLEGIWCNNANALSLNIYIDVTTIIYLQNLK